LPGSRGQEIEANLASILRAAATAAKRMPTARFVVGALHEKHAARIEETMQSLSPELTGLDLRVETGRTRSLMREAACAIAVSGSVSLELLAARVPTVIVYRINGFAHVVQSWFRHARFITLVNLLACREPIGPVQPVLVPPLTVPPADPEAVYPEYLAVGDPAERSAAHVIEWLTDAAARRRAVERIEVVAAVVARPGSAARAADSVLAIAGGSDVAIVADRRAA
jgi:lipid-A-disaccharide synthase